MDIDRLTIGQIKSLRGLIGIDNEVSDNSVLSEFIGKPVLIRADRKGVQVGIVKKTDSQFIYLNPSRKLWQWQAAEGVALESVVKYGIATGTRATGICENDAIRLDDICGITDLTSERYSQIMEWPTSEQD